MPEIWHHRYKEKECISVNITKHEFELSYKAHIANNSLGSIEILYMECFHKNAIYSSLI